MIIIFDKPNQLCNRLWAMTPFIAQSLNNKTKIKILFSTEYQHEVKRARRIDRVSFTCKHNRFSYWWFKILIETLSFFPKSFLNRFNLYFHLNSKNIDKEIFKIDKNIIFLSSRKAVKPNEYLKPYFSDIHKLFCPKKQYLQKVENIFNIKRERFNIIIGVHIRRGDYEKFRNGIYFYTDTEYIHYMKQLINEMNTVKAGFLLCSDSSIEINKFSSMPVFSIPKSEIIEDLYALSLCDYIIGPPSTYSMWASFYGQKPLYFIKKPDGELRLNDFSIVVAQNKFENGGTFSH